MGVLDTFTKRAKHVLGYAQEEATHFNHPYVGTVHLLLGLTRDQDGVAGKVLHDLGVQHAQARSAVEFIVGHGDGTGTNDALEVLASAKQVLVYALEEGRKLNHHYVGTEHLLLGMVRTGDGVAAGVLEIMGVHLEQVRTAVLRELRLGPPIGAMPAHAGPRRPGQRRALGGREPRSHAASVYGGEPMELNAAQRGSSGTGRPLILIVDETPETQWMYREVLAYAGYQVLGVPLVELAQSQEQYERPDLLLLDWVLGQEGRGMQILQQLKLWPATANLPTLVAAVPISTVDDLPGYLRSKGVAALAKPFTSEELLAAVAAALAPPAAAGTAPGASGAGAT